MRDTDGPELLSAQLGAVALATLVVLVAGAPAALGAAIGSAGPAAYGLVVVYRAIGSLVPSTFQSQPYAAGKR